MHMKRIKFCFPNTLHVQKIKFLIKESVPLGPPHGGHKGSNIVKLN